MEMARGKYGEKAAKRQAELAVTSDLATYQHRVAKLTEENRRLREQLAAQQRTAAQAERRLRAERDEGVAPQMQAVVLQLRSAIAARDEARSRARLMQKRWDEVGKSLTKHYRADHGMTAIEAFEAVCRVMNSEAFADGFWISDPSLDGIPHGTALSNSQRLDLQRARGARS